MSIISHLLYDEQKSATYQNEAESILYQLSGASLSDAEALGRGRSYRMALTEILRHLTLFDLYYDPALFRGLSNERCRIAARAAGEILRKNGWEQLKETA